MAKATAVMMKQYTRLILLTLAAACLLTAALLFAGCNAFAGRDEDPYAGLSEDERRIRTVADAALLDKYDLPGWEYFDITVDYGSNGNIYVDYDFVIGSYTSYESYKVTLSAEETVTYVDGFNAGDYSRYCRAITPEAVAAAEASMAEQMERYGEKDRSDYYLYVDDQGYLCLTCEVIVTLEGAPDGYSGCGIDHDHVFITARICPPPSETP